jgi:uncharacterized protein (DUF2235 family)
VESRGKLRINLSSRFVDLVCASAQPEAPSERSRFALDGASETFEIIWISRFIRHDLRSPANRGTNNSEEPIMLGQNLRTSAAARKSWRLKRLNALAETWADFAGEKLGGVCFDGELILG